MTVTVNATAILYNDSTVETTASDYRLTSYTANGTWAAAKSGLKAVRVTVTGGGGSGGPATYLVQGKNLIPGQAGGGGGGGCSIARISGPAITGPVAVTVGTAPGGTSSFGSFASATGGANGPAVTGTTGGGGAGGTSTTTPSPTISDTVLAGENGAPGTEGDGGRAAGLVAGRGGLYPAGAATGRGNGGAGAARTSPGTTSGGAGTGGIVIVEEFY